MVFFSVFLCYWLCVRGLINKRKQKQKQTQREMEMELKEKQFRYCSRSEHNRNDPGVFRYVVCVLQISSGPAIIILEFIIIINSTSNIHQRTGHNNRIRKKLNNCFIGGSLSLPCSLPLFLSCVSLWFWWSALQNVKRLCNCRHN